MIPLIKAEYRKLLTIRSTYILLGVAALLTGFVSFWVMGIKGDHGSTSLLMDAAGVSATIVPTFLAIIAVLHITHEYRYNTIMYTLTASNSRSKILTAKLAVLLAFGALATLSFMLFAVLAAWLGIVVSGDTLATQYFYVWDIVWKALFYGLAWVAIGLLFGVLFRHVVGAIVALFIPSTIEGLLSMLLKENSKYMPFTALEQVHTSGGSMSPGRSALLFSAYLLVVWAIGWYLFLKRDAN